MWAGILTPKAEYRMRRIQYWPVIEIDSGRHGGSIGGGVYRANAVVESGDGEITRGQGF